MVRNRDLGWDLGRAIGKALGKKEVSGDDNDVPSGEGLSDFPIDSDKRCVLLRIRLLS